MTKSMVADDIKMHIDRSTVIQTRFVATALTCSCLNNSSHVIQCFSSALLHDTLSDAVVLVQGVGDVEG